MTYRLLVQQNSAWHELDLPNDFNLSLVLNSGFLGSKQSGSFSFSSQIPTTPKNCMVLQNAENPQIIMDRRIELPAVLMCGSDELYTWYFILRNVSDTSYKYDLRQTPGNQPRNFYERKLWQLDFGFLDFPSVIKKSNFWTIDLYDNQNLFKYFVSPPENPIEIIFGGNLRLPNPVYFEIWINNVLVAKTPTGGSSDAVDYWFNTPDYEARFLIVTKNITTHDIVMSIPKRGTGSINVVSRKDQNITEVKIKIFEHYLSNHIEKGAFIKEYSLVNLSYNDVTEAINNLSKNPNNHPFKFLTYFNESFYPTDNTQYEGIVNQYVQSPSDGSLKLNAGFEYNSYPISPCFSLKFMLEKVAIMMGFTLSSVHFQDKILSADKYLGELHLINNVDFATQLPGTTIPSNVYGTKMTFANFMPDWTVKELIDAVRTTFCLAVEYDFENTKLIITECSDTINSKSVIDLTAKISRYPTAEITDKTNYQLSFKNADEKAISQKHYPTDEFITNSELSYTKIEAGFTPVLNNLDLDEFRLVDSNPYIPTCNETARSIIYIDQQKNRPVPKLCFYLGNDSNGLSYVAKSDNRNTKMVLAWENQGTLKGLLEFYRFYLEFLNNTTQWTADIWLSESEIANFRFAQKYLAYGTVFIPETINPKLPIKDKMKITLLSI